MTVIFLGGTITELVERQKASYRDAQGMTVWPIIPENDCFYYLEDTLKALEFLHSKGIVHRDIKGDQVLFKAIY